MSSRIIGLITLSLTIGFFALHYVFERDALPRFIKTLHPKIPVEPRIVLDEFLILMDTGDEKYTNDVLRQFDLKLISPLGEWLHARSISGGELQEIANLHEKRAQDNQDFIKRIEAHPHVHSAHLNFVQTTDPMISCRVDKSSLPRDPYFRYQWHLSSEDGIDIISAWNITKGSEKTIIGLVDRNFDKTALDFSANSCTSRSYFFENILDYFPKNNFNRTDGNHGELVLSVLAPCTNNSLGLSGIDWHAQVFAIDSKADASLATRMFGLLWAAGIDICDGGVVPCVDKTAIQKNMHPSNLINASFGFGATFLDYPPYGPVLDVVGQINRRKGILVASVGNESSFADKRLPGSAGGVISVGASTQKQQSAYFSNFGKSVDVLAPGENIVGFSKNTPILLNGTSYSAPIVSGVVGLMLAVNPRLQFKEVEYILKITATQLSCSDYCPFTMPLASQNQCRELCCEGERAICAYGIINAFHAVRRAQLGVFAKTLIDIDDYYLSLSKDTALTAAIIIKNFGTKTAVVKMTSTDHNLTMKPQNILIKPVDKNGDPGIAKASVVYHHEPKSGVVIDFTLHAADLDTPHLFHDQIEAVAEIVPDASPARRRSL